LIFNPNRDILRVECLYESALIANTQLIYRVLSTCLSFGYCYLVRSTAKASHGSSNSNLTMFLSWTTDRSIRHYSALKTAGSFRPSGACPTTTAKPGSTL